MKTDKVFNTLTTAFVVLVLLLSTEALFPLLQPPDTEHDISTADLVGGNPIVQITWLGIYGITLLLIFPRLKQFIRLVTSDKLLLLLVVIILISILWSMAPEVTLRRSVAFVGTTLFGTYLAMRYSPRELMWLLALALGTAALLSLVVALGLPSYGVEHDTSRGLAWKGIFNQKNQLGQAMALSGVVFFLLAFDSRTHPHRTYRWALWLGFGLSLGLLFMSNAVGPTVILFTLLLLLALLYGGLQTHYPLNIVFFVSMALTGVLIFAVLLSNTEGVLVDVLGRDRSFTGRTAVWPAVLDKIWERPLLGYGYGGFWLGWEGESAHVWNQTVGVTGYLKPYHAHNGILDLWLNIGLLGVATFAAGFLRTFLRALSWAYLTRSVGALWLVAILMQIVLGNLFESFVRQNNILWMLYIYVTIVLCVTARYAVADKIDFIDVRPRGGVEPRRLEVPRRREFG